MVQRQKHTRGVGMKEARPSRKRELGMLSLLRIQYISDAVLRSRPASIRLGLVATRVWMFWEDFEI